MIVYQELSRNKKKTFIFIDITKLNKYSVKFVYVAVPQDDTNLI